LPATAVCIMHRIHVVRLSCATPGKHVYSLLNKRVESCTFAYVCDVIAQIHNKTVSTGTRVTRTCTTKICFLALIQVTAIAAAILYYCIHLSLPAFRALRIVLGVISLAISDEVLSGRVFNCTHTVFYISTQ